MPEGPSIVILKELVQDFEQKEIIGVTGNSKIDKEKLLHKTVLHFRSWGKHFLMDFGNFFIRIHFLMFGSYRINERKEGTTPRLSLQFRNGELNFYSCGIKLIEENLDEIYDWTSDVMNDAWGAEEAKEKLKAHPEMLACDALLDQNIFSGSGNIIKNEVLFRIQVHPESKIGALPETQLDALIAEVRNYSFDFYRWKKEFVLRKHWLAHTKRTCPRCNIPFIKKKLGITNRRSFYCENCQFLFQ